MEVLNATQMRLADAYAIDTLGIPSLTLMEAAGRGCADALLEDCPEVRHDGVTILCGKGNNGGDGLVIARRLREHDVAVRVVSLANPDDLSPDAATQLGLARTRGIAVVHAPDAAAWERHRDAVLGGRPWVVDAILGTGVRGGARGLAAEAIADLHAAEARVVSVDLPSGMDADRADVPRDALVVRAARTYTLCRPKLPLVAGGTDAHCGTWRVVPIGIPDAAVAAAGSDVGWTDADAAGALVRRRAPGDHKGTFGHLLVVAGSLGTSGAATLAATAALRSGAGLVTVAAPEPARTEVAIGRPEAMTARLPDLRGRFGAPSTETAIAQLLSSGPDALAIGPGIGRGPGSDRAVRAVLRSTTAPAVVDADALNVSSPLAGPLAPPDGAPRVLTPHPGEAGRLLECTVAAVQADRMAAAREIASRADAVVVLKGHRSVVARPDGAVAFNSSGNPGLATAGAGDVLTGVVGAALAAGMPPWDAARFGTYVHGVAGDLASAAIGAAGSIAGDVARRLPEAIAALERRT